MFRTDRWRFQHVASGFQKEAVVFRKTALYSQPLSLRQMAGATGYVKRCFPLRGVINQFYNQRSRYKPAENCKYLKPNVYIVFHFHIGLV
jgi:hypothetical protein